MTGMKAIIWALILTFGSFAILWGLSTVTYAAI